jgi:cellulose synthase/poly-beta-1,6-N-acetylglucosamine synthase-like glycosyltransferase
MEKLSLLPILVLYLLSGYLLLNVLYLLFFALAGHGQSKLLPSMLAAPPRRICVLIAAYQADAVILETVPSALQHFYSGQADIYVIADGLQPSTVQTLRDSGAGVVEVVFEKSTKGKALLAALNFLPGQTYDIAVVLDVDNIMAPGFLTQVNAAFEAGYRVVQGHRTAKNLDSPFAVLDACNEEINNHIFRQGHVNIGMSSALIGSGMAFDYNYFHQLLQDIGDTPGEDKELDFRILMDKYKIAYLPKALVYDEKIPNSKVFATQRTRWIATQIEFLQKYFNEGFRQLSYGNIDFFDKVLQSMLLPRVLLLGVLCVLLAISAVWPVGPGSMVWAGLLAGTCVALALSLPAGLYNKQVARAIWHLPIAVGAMLLALLQIKKAKTSFMPTPHLVSTKNKSS